jgi:hypothetical protein
MNVRVSDETVLLFLDFWAKLRSSNKGWDLWRASSDVSE